MPQVSQPESLLLLLPEQLILLAFGPWNGRLGAGMRPRPYLEAALAGAVLTELALRESIAVEPRPGSARKFRVSSTASPAGEPFLDAVSAQVRAEKPRTLDWWIRKGLPGMYRLMLDRLTAAGLVTTTHGVMRQHNVLSWPQARSDALARVQQVLLADPARVAGLWTTDPRSASLASLAFSCRVLEVGGLPRDQRRLAGANLRAVRATDPIGLAVLDVIERARRAKTAINSNYSYIYTPTNYG
jgi:Golgi phosphoprotein 3 (GPP34)